MFKKILLLIAVLLPMSAFAQKFAVVDIQAVMEAMPEVAAAQTQLDASKQQFGTELQKIQEELNKLYNEFQTIADDASTPQSIKERRMSELNEKAQKVEQFRLQAEQDLAQQTQQLMAPIQAKIVDAIKAVGQEGGYTAVMPKDDGLLIYMGPDMLDVTNAVKGKLGL
ncbi:MAG: OmpH family outer membrane protein [Muribaculaceae bacterium]|nr:OmpH family outer membrane protein [Muribaculaceae bacterium]